MVRFSLGRFCLVRFRLVRLSVVWFRLVRIGVVGFGVVECERARVAISSSITKRDWHGAGLQQRLAPTRSASIPFMLCPGDMVRDWQS